MDPQPSQTTYPAAEFTWRAHPAGERPRPAVLGAALALGVAGAVYAFSDSMVWGAFALALLAAALNRFYFPSRFDIDAQGITARFPLVTRRLRWADVQRFVADEHGGYLSPRARRSRLDAYGGLHVLFGNDRAAVVQRIRAHLRRDGDA